MRQMTHAGFIELCRKHRIPIDRITRDYVYVNDEVPSSPSTPSFFRTPPQKPVNFPYLPDNYKHLIIDPNWQDPTTGISLAAFLDEGRKVQAIKLLRFKLGLELKESVDIIKYWFNEL